MHLLVLVICDRLVFCGWSGRVLEIYVGPFGVGAGIIAGVGLFMVWFFLVVGCGG